MKLIKIVDDKGKEVLVNPEYVVGVEPDNFNYYGKLR